MPRPTESTPVDLDLWPEALDAHPVDAKVDAAIALERAARSGDPRISGVRTAVWSDGLGEAAVATNTGIQVWSRAGTCYLAVQALAADDGDTQIGFGLSVGREPADLDIDEAAADAVLPRRRACSALASPPPAGCRSCSSPA